jgi:hypothetical protein
MRDFRSDWSRWTTAERVLAFAIMAGMLVILSSMSGLGGH